jgi:hypothetical protein
MKGEIDKGKAVSGIVPVSLLTGLLFFNDDANEQLLNGEKKSSNNYNAYNLFPSYNYLNRCQICILLVPTPPKHEGISVVSYTSLSHLE